MAGALITLTTDFGTTDGFVAAMKGVILALTPGSEVVDITHDVPPGDVAHASFVLGSVFRYWPPGTIHVAVVDPGVGTRRRPLLLADRSGRMLIGPDNGIFSHVLAVHGRTPGAPGGRRFLSPYRASPPPGIAAYAIESSRFRLPEISRTFHGRDVFAPAAAALAAGASPSLAGRVVDRITYLNLPGAARVGRHVEGRVQHIDHFGNLITDIPRDARARGAFELRIGGRTISGLSDSYQAAGGLGCVVGSHDFLEVFVTAGNARDEIGVTVGDPVVLREAGWGAIEPARRPGRGAAEPRG
jgi:S-adenosylmethionine hydrolase